MTRKIISDPRDQDGMCHPHKQLTWPSGKSQACHAEGPGFAPVTLQGVLFPVAAHHTTLFMAVGKGLGRLVQLPSRCWEATCGWG